MAEEEKQLLVPLDNYLKSGIHIGTKFRTKYMEPFIYKVRPDGLTVLNIQEIDKRIGFAAKFISNYDSKDIVICCRRENGWKAIKEFSKATGIKVFTGRYPPGILTNIALDTFMETRLLIVADPWPDKNVVKDGIRMGIPVIALCDTNNESNNIDYVIPCNNKGKKSIGLIFWILAREFIKNKGLGEIKAKLEDFSDE